MCCEQHGPFTTTVSVSPLDSFTQAAAIVRDSTVWTEDDLPPLVLNMANATTPGGGVSHGSYSQEEDLFRRSNYFMTLNKMRGYYPIYDSSGIYSPNVTVFKDANYELMETPITVSCIAVAAIRNPPKLSDGDGGERFADPDHKAITREKIHTIFQTALLMGHRHLVLGALGCGAFHNPLGDIVELFQEAITLYQGQFKTITFAVRSYEDPNYAFFKENLG